MINPFVKLRDKTNLSRQELADALFVSVSTVAQIERGIPSTLGPVVMAGLRTRGLPAEKLRDQYEAWRHSLVATNTEAVEQALSEVLAG